MSHTPGPWHVFGGTSVFSFDIVGPKAEDIGYANLSDGADEPTLYPAKENAQLMAAAPELLEALKAMEHTSMRLGITRGNDDDDAWAAALLAHFEAIKQAREAIAKAEGRSDTPHREIDQPGAGRPVRG